MSPHQYEHATVGDVARPVSTHVLPVIDPDLQSDDGTGVTPAVRITRGRAR